MQGINNEIDEKAYLEGVTLWDAISKFGSESLIQQAIDLSNGVPNNGIKTGLGFLGVLGAAVATVNQLQANKLQHEQIIGELKAEILNLIKKGDLIPLGYKEPREIQDKPIKIPSDLFFNSEINWNSSELKSKNFEFSSIRLLQDLMPVIDIEKNNSKNEISKLNNKNRG